MSDVRLSADDSGGWSSQHKHATYSTMIYTLETGMYV